MATRNARLFWLVPALLPLGGSVGIAADPPNLTLDQATSLLHEGKRQDALHALDAIIAANPPDPSPALFVAGLIDLEDGNWRAARPYVQRLVKLRPSSFQAWELMIQADQAAGDRDDGDAAIQSLYTTWKSALDPAVRSRVSFARDRIVGPKHTVVAQETLEPGGDDIVRFVFQPQDQEGLAQHLMVVRSDNETNERWRDNGTVAEGATVFHLDTIQQLAGGQQSAVPYEYYVDAPDYERVRAKVVEILAGTAAPLTGRADPFWAGEPAH